MKKIKGIDLVNLKNRLNELTAHVGDNVLEQLDKLMDCYHLNSIDIQQDIDCIIADWALWKSDILELMVRKGCSDFKNNLKEVGGYCTKTNTLLTSQEVYKRLVKYEISILGEWIGE